MLQEIRETPPCFLWILWPVYNTKLRELQIRAQIKWRKHLLQLLLV